MLIFFVSRINPRACVYGACPKISVHLFGLFCFSRYLILTCKFASFNNLNTCAFSGVFLEKLIRSFWIVCYVNTLQHIQISKNVNITLQHVFQTVKAELQVCFSKLSCFTNMYILLVYTCIYLTLTKNKYKFASTVMTMSELNIRIIYTVLILS